MDGLRAFRTAELAPAEPWRGRWSVARWRRAVLTALGDRADVASVTITHPFHPFHGQRLEVLKTRRVGGEDVLILRRSTGGTFPVAREWTDRAQPTMTDLLGRPIVHDPERLRELAKLIKALDEGETQRLSDFATSKIDGPEQTPHGDSKKT